ncbi:MAG: insulinase family protein [Gemmatimonadetes bacterium]|nr:insulinase family protein [Gemmatimonadota bacterium]
MTVLIREDRSAPVVAIVTHVRSGYLDEPDAVTGISHVLEHMFFKGTPRLGPGELGRATKALGGVLNASTGYDRTFYYTVLPASAVEKGIELQADALQHSTLDAGELDRELQVIIQEAKRKLDAPAAVAAESLYEAMFDAHRLRRWRIGTEAGLAQLTRDDVLRWYRTTYRPERVVLSIAGDVDVASTIACVERHYSALRGDGEAPEPGPAEPERRAFRYREMEGDTRRAWLEWGWRTRDPLHEDTPLLDVLAAVLGQGRASRLYRAVRDTGLASQIAARNQTHRDVGVLNISAVTEPGDALAAMRAIASTVRSIETHRVHEDELERARSIAEARLLQTLETVEGQATLVAAWEALGDWQLFETYFARISTATSTEIERVAAEYLDMDAATVLAYRPAGSPAVATVEGVEAALRDAAATIVHTDAASPPARTASARQARRIGTDGDVHTFEIAGRRCIIQPRRSTPLVSMGLFYRGGAADENHDTAGFTALMARATLQGTTWRTAARIATETEALGGAIAPQAEPDTFSWSLTVPSRHLEAGFELLCDVAGSPVFPAEETGTERKATLARLQQVRDDMYAYPIRLALEAAFRGDAYGLTIEQVEAALGAMDPGQLRGWHARAVRNGSPLVVIVGDVDADVAARLVAQFVDGGDATAADLRSPQWSESGIAREVQRETAQTALALAFPGPARNHPDALALRLLANAVAGLGGSLFEELRSRRSLAYTVSAFPISHWRGGAFIAYIATSPAREAEASAAMLEQIGRLRDELLDESELERARRYALGAREIRRQTNSARMGEIAGAELIGRGLEEIRDYESRVLAVTPDTVRDAAWRWLDPARAMRGVVRGTGGGR